MKKIILMVSLLLIICLCSCSNKTVKLTVPEGLAAQNANGDVLQLYMDREEAEKILGETSERSWNGCYDYENIMVGYSNGVLAYVAIKDDSWKLMNGIKVNDPIDSISEYNNIGKMAKVLYYLKDDDGFTQIAKETIPEKVQKNDFGKYCASEILNIDEKVSVISFYDKYIALTGEMED
jgi:hypothetical protein